MAYISQIVLDGTTYLVGSSLYGVCNTAPNIVEKVIDSGILGTQFNELIDGITVHIQFTYGNTAENLQLKVGTTNAVTIIGDCKCDANAVLSFTYGLIGTERYWILNSGGSNAMDVQNTYDSSSEAPISGKGVADAIAPLLPNGDNASAKGVDTVITSAATDDKVPTSRAVYAYVSDAIALNDALVFKGTLGSGGTVFSLPTSNYKTGWTYRVVSAGTYAGQVCEVGDLIIAIEDGPASSTNITNAHWTVAQTNIDGVLSGPVNATPGHVAVFGANETQINDSGYTIASSVPSDAVFTDTKYEDKGTASAVTNIQIGSDVTLASIITGVLNIAPGLTITHTNVSTGIKEV